MIQNQDDAGLSHIFLPASVAIRMGSKLSYFLVPSTIQEILILDVGGGCYTKVAPLLEEGSVSLSLSLSLSSRHIYRII